MSVHRSVRYPLPHALYSQIIRLPFFIHRRSVYLACFTGPHFDFCLSPLEAVISPSQHPSSGLYSALRTRHLPHSGDVLVAHQASTVYRNPGSLPCSLVSRWSHLNPSIRLGASHWADETASFTSTLGLGLATHHGRVGLSESGGRKSDCADLWC